MARGNTETVSESAVRGARDLVVMFSRLRRRLREVGATDGLSPSQTSVLSRLGKDGPSSASLLAAAERVRPQSMSAILATLDELGLIHRAPDPDDGRRQLITLTAAGRDRFQGLRQAREEWLVRALQDDCTPAERQIVVNAMAVLERITRP